MTIFEGLQATSVRRVVDQLIIERRRKRIVFVGFVILALVPFGAVDFEFGRGVTVTLMFSLVADLLSINRCLNICRAVPGREVIAQDFVEHFTHERLASCLTNDTRRPEATGVMNYCPD